MMKKLLPGLLTLGVFSSQAQFAPPAGQAGTTAISQDSSIFVGWATACSIVRGFQDISDPSLGLATAGDSSSALGNADGTSVVSLGDAGEALLTFPQPIANGPGWDFAVFENSFADDYLELAFVEVSSDGINFVRFPATSFTQDTTQIDGFGLLDATKINNLAGKYRGLFGTPFDLQELSSEPLLDVNAITHVKIIDVVGSIQDTYATYDQLGNKVNDPWPTPFASGGFDLDAVGVIHHTGTVGMAENRQSTLQGWYPNPARDQAHIHHDTRPKSIVAVNSLGQSFELGWSQYAEELRIDLSRLPNGVYTVLLEDGITRTARKLIVRHE